MTTQSTPVKSTEGVGRGGSLTFRPFLEDSKFSFTLYHAGKVNIILHAVSLSFLLYGLAVKSVLLVLIGLFVFDEMGHAYNYFFVHNRDPRFGLRMIPYQLLYASLGMPVLLKLFGWF
jgi:hypothetical protein